MHDLFYLNNTHVHICYTYIMLHEPFTQFTLPETVSESPPFHRGGEGGEWFGEDAVCIGRMRSISPMPIDALWFCQELLKTVLQLLQIRQDKIKIFFEGKVLTTKSFCSFVKENFVMYLNALDRIHQLELTEEHFQMPDDFDLATYFYNLYGVSIDWERFPTDTIRIKAKNTEGYHQVHYLRTLPLHHTQKEVEKHPGYSIFEVRLSPSLDFIYEILSKGDEVEVLSPQWFREEIAGYARAFYQMYKDDIDILNKRDQSLQK